ncbi:vesicle-associated protein 2-1 isoform X2 [Salvia miltiorrhiza]|uniref:vesicle-associated protein 2-1 isoform X2 n=1 Tax=Salvia miltiorrhiza TaxID=226208 RepID=UPI0025ABC833|nr:vesicle-associated protein 2-1 isoform X2 [Salvia miltiorrhiza]
MTIAARPLICVQPEDLKFQFELDKQSYCDLKVTNNTEHHVAFKVKTTSPKKYFVRPNTGVMQPWDSCLVRVTLHIQREYPPNMQCKDKFLVQSTIVPPITNVDELPQDTFNKEVGDTLQECKLRVIYVREQDGLGRNSGANGVLQRLRDERDAAVSQSQKLQQDLEIYKRRRSRKNNYGLSVKFTLLVGLIGMAMGFLLNFLSSEPSQ